MSVIIAIRKRRFHCPVKKLSAGKYNFPATAPAKLHVSAKISTRIEACGYFRAGGSASASFIYRFYRQSCAFPTVLFPRDFCRQIKEGGEHR